MKTAVNDLFVELYKKVFDEDNKIKACGRALCSQLIMLAEQIDSTKEYGNSNTGFLNVENIQALYASIS